MFQSNLFLDLERRKKFQVEGTILLCSSEQRRGLQLFLYYLCQRTAIPENTSKGFVKKRITEIQHFQIQQFNSIHFLLAFSTILLSWCIWAILNIVFKQPKIKIVHKIYYFK